MADLTNSRIPPHSQEAEQGILGCLLWDASRFNDVAVKVGEEEFFYDLRHQSIYDSIKELADANVPVEIITLQQKLKDKHQLDQVGGIAYLSSIQDSVPSAANLPYYLDIVWEKHLQRKIIRTCNDVVARAYETDDVGQLLDEAERDVLAIGNARVGSQSLSIKEACKQAVAKMQEMFERQGKIGGLSTGLHDLDRLTDGLHGGEMIVLAAYPSCGKSALAGQIAFYNALNTPTAIFSCEMRESQVTMRAICNEARVNLYHIRDGIAAETDIQRMTAATAKISKLPIFIENSSGWSVGQVTAKARRLKQQHGIGLVIIDYIQLLSCEAGNREQEVNAISRGIKHLAMELNVPVIALSQLNDDGKLKEARAIGENADSVWKISNDGEWEQKIQPVILSVEKNREGATGIVNLLFRKEFTRFEQASKIDERDVP
jgi:replicative DNA helicase